MAKRKRPKELGFFMWVRHPQSEDGEGIIGTTPDGIPIGPAVDRDGHHVSFSTEPMPGDCLASVSLRCGTSPRTASAILRKLADYIDEHGGILLNRRRGNAGTFGEGGLPELDELQVDFDDNDDPITPVAQ